LIFSQKYAKIKEETIELDSEDDFDGLSGWVNNTIPIIVINKNFSLVIIGNTTARFLHPSRKEPSSENIAKYVFDQLKEELIRYPVRLRRVSAWESDTSRATYFGR